MGLRPAKRHEKQSRVAQTCRSLACLRPCLEGAYIPPKYGGTYAPPWFFDPAMSRRDWSALPAQSSGSMRSADRSFK